MNHLLGKFIEIYKFDNISEEANFSLEFQISAAHTEEHIDMAVSAFEKIGKKLGVIWSSFLTRYYAKFMHWFILCDVKSGIMNQ